MNYSYLILAILSLALASIVLVAEAQTTWYTLGLEPDESSVSPWGGTQLDIVSLKASNDSSNIYFNISVAGTIAAPSTGSLNWVIYIDSDRSSRTSCSFGYDYAVYVKLYNDSYRAVEIWDSGGNYVGGGSVVAGGPGTTYWEISVPLSSIGNPSAIYVRAATIDSNGNTDDTVPEDNTGGNALGDWWIYYLASPTEPALATQSDAAGDASGYYDILSVSSGLDSSNLYLKMSVNGVIPYYESSTSGAIYHFYIDSDNNSSTGYSVGGIGADYMVEYITGWVPKLYKYAGSGTDWNWSLVSCEDYYPSNPGGGTVISIVVPLSDFSTTLSNPAITADTADPSGNVKDTLDTPLPIPEPVILVIAVALALSSLIIMYYRRG